MQNEANEIVCEENKPFEEMSTEAKNAEAKNTEAKDAEEKNMEVQDALLKCATGYTVTVKKAFKLKDVHYDERGKKVETERLEICEEEQYFPPGLPAQTYWLKNRCPELWGEKREDEAQEQGGIVVLPQVLEPEEEDERAANE